MEITLTSKDVYADDIQIGDRIHYDKEVCIVESIDDVPLTEEELYAPAKPDRRRFTLRYQNDTYEEISMWETDTVEVLR